MMQALVHAPLCRSRSTASAGSAGDGAGGRQAALAVRRVWPVAADYARLGAGVVLLTVAGSLAWPALWYVLDWTVEPVWSVALALLLAAGWAARQWRLTGWLRAGGLLSRDADGRWYFSQPGTSSVSVQPQLRGLGIGWASLWLSSDTGRAALVCWRVSMHVDDWRALRLALGELADGLPEGS